MIDLIKTKVAGIPCTIEVIEPPIAPDADADNLWDYQGSVAIWAVCDTHGRPAPWIDEKLTGRDIERINEEVRVHYAG